MELKKLLVGLDNLKVRGNLDVEISGIESNSKNVKEGYLFVAIKGFSTDGHQYVESAIQNGAVAVMIHLLLKVPYLQIISKCNTS